jgi:hypothetical protein
MTAALNPPRRRKVSDVAYFDPWWPTLSTSASSRAPFSMSRASVCASASPVKSIEKSP